MFGVRRGEGTPIDQWTTGRLWYTIVVLPPFAMGTLAAALFFLYVMFLSLLHLREEGSFPLVWFTFMFAGFAILAIVLWSTMLEVGKELWRRKKNGKKSGKKSGQSRG